MSAYAYYNQQDYDSCIGAATRYVTLHPGSPDAAYAQYLIAASHYDQIPDISRDQARTGIEKPVYSMNSELTESSVEMRRMVSASKPAIDSCRILPHARASSRSGIVSVTTSSSMSDSAMRSTALPDVPVMGESVPGYEASQWYGLGAPRNTPAEVIDKLNKEINAVAADPNMKARLDGLGVDPMSMTSAEFGKFIADETEKWGKVIRAANIKAE